MNDSHEQTVISLLILMMMIIIGAVCFLLGSIRTERHLQYEAIKNGHAVWTADASGKATFQWK